MRSVLGDAVSYLSCIWLLLFCLLGVASNVGIMKMSFCGIPHLVFTRGRASIVLAFSSWCIEQQQEQKQPSKYHSPMHFVSQESLKG